MASGCSRVRTSWGWAVQDLDRAQIVRGVADLHRAASDACELGRDEDLAAEVDAVLEYPAGLIGHQHPAQPRRLDDVQRNRRLAHFCAGVSPPSVPC